MNLHKINLFAHISIGIAMFVLAMTYEFFISKALFGIAGVAMFYCAYYDVRLIILNKKFNTSKNKTPVS